MRTIRLYEYEPNNKKYFPPQGPEYLEKCIDGLFENTGWEINVDNEGFIIPYGSSDSEHMHGGCILLGDSILENLFVREDERIEYQLSKINEGIKYYNCGRSSATSVDIINTVINKIVPCQPDQVFLMSGVYDCAVSEAGIYSNKAGTCTIKNSRFYDFKTGQYETRRILLESTIKLLKCFNIRVGIGTFGHRFNANDPYIEKFSSGSTNRFANKFCMMNEITRSLSREADYFIDFEKIFFNHFDCYYDKWHLTANGARIIATELNKHGF